MDILKKRMRDLREDADLKQTALADALGLSRSVVSVYENGREPPLEVIFKYSEYFGVTVDWLLGLSNEPYPMDGEERAIDDMQAAADARGEKALSRGDVVQLAKAFVGYYKAGAVADGLPMDCVRAFLAAMCKVLDAAAAQDAPALLLACNEVARAGLLSSDIMAASLGVDTSKTDDSQ